MSGAAAVVDWKSEMTSERRCCFLRFIKCAVGLPDPANAAYDPFHVARLLAVSLGNDVVRGLNDPDGWEKGLIVLEGDAGDR